MEITIERAIEILDPTHREHYNELPDGMEQVNEACRIGMQALMKQKEEQKSMRMKIILDKDAIMPVRAHETDAGLDLFAREDKTVYPCSSVVFDTGVHIELPAGTVGMLKSKSGLNTKHGLQSEGVIDAGYTGSIAVKLYNHSGFSYDVKKGDKISQLVILPIITPELELATEFEKTDRGDNGFGSSGR